MQVRIQLLDDLDSGVTSALDGSKSVLMRESSDNYKLELVGVELG